MHPLFPLSLDAVGISHLIRMRGDWRLAPFHSTRARLARLSKFGLSAEGGGWTPTPFQQMDSEQTSEWY